VSELEQAANKIQKVFRGKKDRDAVKSSDKDKDKKAAPAKAKGKDSKHGVPKMVLLFRGLDISGDGMLQVEEFVHGLEQLPGITDLKVQGKPLDKEMLMAIARAIDASNNGTINYLEFLKAFEVDQKGGQDIVDSLAEDITTVLFRHRVAIRMGCHYLDEEGIGKIRAEDFQTVLQGVNSALSRPERTLTNQQISLLVEAMTVVGKEEDTVAGEHVVDYDAFLQQM